MWESPFKADDPMRNKIFGVIGILWGGAMVISMLTRGVRVGTGSYGAGVIIGQLMGVLMLVAGIYYVVKPSDSPPPRKKKKKRTLED